MLLNCKNCEIFIFPLIHTITYRSQSLVADLCHCVSEGSGQTLNVSVPVTEGACSMLSHQGQYNGFLSRSRCVISSSRQMAWQLTFADQPSISLSLSLCFTPNYPPCVLHTSINLPGSFVVLIQHTSILLSTWKPCFLIITYVIKLIFVKNINTYVDLFYILSLHTCTFLSRWCICVCTLR